MGDLKYVTPADLGHTLEHLRVIDVRTPDEYYSADGHLPGSELVPLVLLPQAMDHWSTHKPILLVGAKAPQAGALLVSRGFEVLVLQGGMRAWLAAGMRARRMQMRAQAYRTRRRRWAG